MSRLPWPNTPAQVRRLARSDGYMKGVNGRLSPVAVGSACATPGKRVVPKPSGDASQRSRRADPKQVKRKLFLVVGRTGGFFKRWTDEDGHIGHPCVTPDSFDRRDLAATRFIRQ